MIPFDEALRKLLAVARPLGKIEIPLEKSPGFFLARDIVAREPIPLFDQSAMDGYGVRWEDVRTANSGAPVRLPIAQTVQAGGISHNRLGKGMAARIFTGGKIPPDVDTVVVQEWCEEGEGAVSILRSPEKSANIRRKGEEYVKGCHVMPAGTRITPPVVGLLATLGYARVLVYAKPRVGLIVTGDELRKPGEKLLPGQIRDSNSYTIASALRELGIEKLSLRRVRDDRRQLHRAFLDASERADLILSVGGISVGDYDFVKDVAEDIGFKTIFWKVAIKPGMPNYLGARGGKVTPKIHFGLPGNPVAALVSFHQFVKPAILRIMGQPDPCPALLKATVEGPIRKKPGRMEFVRGRLRQENGQFLVSPTKGQESHMLSGLVSANCLIRFPLDASCLNSGDLVEIERIEWSGNSE